jgi:hypothetical protein
MRLMNVIDGNIASANEFVPAATHLGSGMTRLPPKAVRNLIATGSTPARPESLLE